MYSATFGMLWSVCTSTFIPFLSVFAATGNSACPQAPAPPTKPQPSPQTPPYASNMFSYPPVHDSHTLKRKIQKIVHHRRSAAPLRPISAGCKTQDPLTSTPELDSSSAVSLLHYFITSHFQTANTRTGPPDPPSNLIGATIKNAPASGTSLKSERFSS